MSTHRSPMAILLASTAVVLTTLIGGCPPTGTTMPTPTLTGGDSNTSFGTLNDQQGNSYDIALAANGDVQVSLSGSGAVFTVDGQGRITTATGEDGGRLNFDYQADGTVNVTGTAIVDGIAEDFSGTIPAGVLPNAKLNINAQGRDPLIVCVALNALCDVLPVLIDGAIAIFAQEVLNTEFPTGITLIDEGTRALVRSRLPIIAEAEEFCTVWTLWRAVGLDDFCTN